jgi:glucose/arabinose dehydrogenase
VQLLKRPSAAALTRIIASVGAISAILASTAFTAVARPHDELVVGGLDSPTAFTFFDGGILIAEKSGVVRFYLGGRLLASPFLDLRSEVNTDGDRGLLSIAVGVRSSPQLVYLYYADEGRGARGTRSRTMRLVSIETRAARALGGTEKVLLGTADGGDCNALPRGSDCIPANCRCHTGGDVAVAPDGSIFLTTGDATSAGGAYLNALRAQALDSLAGKILRISPAGEGLPSNPFWDGDSRANRAKVWAYGLRNGFRMGLGPAGTVFVGDVGWHLFEEIDRSVGGENFGWPCYEGHVRTPGYREMALCRRLYAHGGAAWPLLAYLHPRWGAAVIAGPYSGGTVYFADYVERELRSLRIVAGHAAGTPRVFARTVGSPVDLRLGVDGWLYYLTFDRGELRRVELG